MFRRSSSSSSSSSSSRSRSRSRDRQRQNNRHRRRSSRSRSSHRSSRRRSSSTRSRSRSRDKHNKNNDRRRSDNDRSSSKSDSYGSSLGGGGGQHHSLPPPPPSFAGVGGVIPPPPMGSVPPPMGASVVPPPPLGSVPPPPFGVIPPPPMAAHLPPPPPGMAANAVKPPTIPPPSSFSSGNKLGNPSPAAAAKKPVAANALKMNLGKVNTAAKSKLATVFNADSSDEEEEMPEEARYKKLFVNTPHLARQLVTSLAPANICYINVGGCPIVSAHFRRYRHDGASSNKRFNNSNFHACLLKEITKSNVILLKIFVKLHIFCVSWSVLLLQNTYAQRRSGHHNLQRAQLLWQDPAGLHRHRAAVRAQAVAGHGPGLQRQHRSGRRQPAQKVTSFLRRLKKWLIITIIESSEEFDIVILENGGKSNYRRCCRLLKPFSAVIYLIFSPNSEFLKQNTNDICKNINFNLLLFCIKIVIFNYFMKIIFKINFHCMNFIINSNVKNLFQLNRKNNLKSNLLFKYLNMSLKEYKYYYHLNCLQKSEKYKMSRIFCRIYF